MAQFTLEFKTKTKAKFMHYIIVNAINKRQCIKQITNALANGIQMDCNINLKKQNEINQHADLIQMLAFELILHYNEFYDFIPHKLNLVDIRNINLIFKFMWHNPLIMKNWMNDETKWTLCFLLLKILLTSCKFRAKKECIDLVLTLTSSMIYWKRQHITFLIKHDYGRAFCSFFINIYLKQNQSSNVFVLLLSITKLIWLIGIPKQSGYSPLWKYVQKWTQNLQSLLFIYINKCPSCELIQKKYKKKCQKKCKKKCRKLHEMIRKLQHELHTIAFSQLQKSPIYDEGRSFSFEKLLEISYKNRIISLKKCGNNKCKKIQNIDFKKCKKCRLIYYCSRYCQKIDWKYNHKKYCDELYTKMKGHSK